MMTKLAISITVLLLTPSLAAEDYSRPPWTERGKLVWGGNLHEPLAFYQRENRPMAGVEANALWLEEWYKNVRSEATVKQLAAIGVNVLYVNFAKGAGGDPAFEDRKQTKEFSTLCRKYGIRTLAYIQFASKHAEEFFVRHPGAEEWQQIDRFGRVKRYGDRYYRVIMCPVNQAYIDYLKQVIESALLEYQMDGVFLDNCYYDACYCPHCQQQFRSFVQADFPEPLTSLGISTLDEVRVPELESREPVVEDRLHQEWLRWRVSIVPRVTASLRAHSKKLKPEAAFCGNIIYPRGNNWHLRGVNPFQILQIFDLAYSEGHSFPVWRNGISTNNYLVMTMGAQLGTNVVAGVWLPGTVLPESADEIALALGESLAYGGHVLAGIWALRMKGHRFAQTPEELSEPYFTRPEIMETWAEYNEFLSRNQSVYTDSRVASPIAIYHSEKSLAYDFGTAYPAFVNVAQSLLQNQVPFGIVFSQDLKRLEEYQTVFVCSQRCLSGEEIAALETFVKNGGELIVTGESGLYDEVRRKRRDYGLARVTGASIFDHLQKGLRQTSFGEGKVTFSPFASELGDLDLAAATIQPEIPEPWQAILRELLPSLKKRFPVEVIAPPNVTFSLFQMKDGTRVVHLINYNNREVAENVCIKTEAASSRLSARSPDGASYTVLEKGEKGSWNLTRLKTYTCLLLGE